MSFVPFVVNKHENAKACICHSSLNAINHEAHEEHETSRQRWFFVSFGYSSDATQESNAFHKRTGRIIKLLTVQEILDEEFVQKMYTG